MRTNWTSRLVEARAALIRAQTRDANARLKVTSWTGLPFACANTGNRA